MIRQQDHPSRPAGLEVRDVSRSFSGPNGPVPVLRDINLAVPGGSLVVVTGPSGAGKSTLLHLAALLDRPDAGGIWVDGCETSRLHERERDRLRRYSVGVVFQRFHVLADRSALENVRLRFRYTGVSRAESLGRAQAALEEVGLGRVVHRPARFLSGGELQRVAMARAMALAPRVLLADEPIGQVDESAASVILDILDRLRSEGVAILAAAHGPALGKRADRIHVLREGTLS